MKSEISTSVALISSGWQWRNSVCIGEAEKASVVYRRINAAIAPPALYNMHNIARRASFSMHRAGGIMLRAQKYLAHCLLRAARASYATLNAIYSRAAPNIAHGAAISAAKKQNAAK